MGNYTSKAWSCVKWIGSNIVKYIIWAKPFIDAINSIVHFFLLLNEASILKADNPKKVGETVAIKKEIEELEITAKRNYERLSSSDKNLIYELLKDRNY